MILDNNFRIRSFLVFVAFMLVLGVLYLLLVIPPQKKIRDVQIKSRITERKNAVTQKIQQSNELYREKIRHFLTNQAIASAFSEEDAPRLKREVQPFMAILEMEQPYYFIINFYKADGTPLLIMQGMRETILPETGTLYVELTNLHQKSHFGYEIIGRGIYYKIVRPVFYNNRYIGCIEFGIRDAEIIKQLREDFQIIPAAYFRISELNRVNWENYEWDFMSDSVLYTFYDNRSIILKGLEESVDGTKKTVQSEGKDYIFLNFGEFRDYGDNLLGGLFCGVEVSDIFASYKKFLGTQLTGIIIIIVIILAIFYLFFGFFFEKIYDLKRTLDKRIAERSREIIDTNNQLNLIFNTTTNAMRMVDKDYNILKVNHAFTSISGYSATEAEGRKCYELFHSENCHTEKCALNRIILGEEKVEYRSDNTHKNGQPVPVIQTAVPLRGNDGEIYGIIEDLKDLTELIKTEDALRLSERDFSMFMDDLPLGVFIKDENSRALYLNKYMDSVFCRSNCLGKRPGDIFPSQIAKRVLTEDARVLGGEIVVVEEALQDKDGNNRIYMTHKFLLRDPGRGNRIGGVSIEITKKVEAERMINLLSQAVENTPVCVVITNTNGNIEYANQAMETLTGYTYEEVVGENISILGSKQDDDLFREMWDAILSGNSWQGQVQNRRKNGELYWERLSISPVKDPDGKVKHFIAVKEDNTRQKEFEARLNEARERAMECDRLKTAFLTNFSHEIRTPMNAILGLTEILIKNKLTVAEKNEFSSNIRENSRVLLKLIDDIIDISRIDAGLVELQEKVCLINQVLDEVYNLFRGKLDNSGKPGLKLIVKKANPLHEFAIMADTERVKQVLNNLVENALKFTDKGSVDFGYVFKDENSLLFFVKDTGPGIPENKLESIFERFQSVDETLTRTHRGTGLGLAISKSIVELMSGKIWVRSNPNEGSAFFFTIPLKISAMDMEVGTGMGKIPLVPELEGKTILVADEIHANYLLIETALKKNSAMALWAKNGLEALEVVNQNNMVDLIIMDIELPVLSGLEALRKIKKERNDLPVIMQTAFSVPEQLEKCIQAGCDGYITKPINIKQLIEKMADCLKAY